MPRRRKSFGRRKSRKGRRKTRRMVGRKRGSRASTAILRSPSGFPDRVFVKLRYAATILMSTTAGSAAGQVFRGNSGYDPDLTNAGHQPYAWDQWSTLYGHYRVHGSKIRCRLIQTDNTSAFTQALWVAVVPSLTTTAPTYPTPLDEQPYVKVRMMGSSNTGTNGMNDISAYMSTSKIFGMSKTAIKAEDNFQAVTTANPTNVWYWKIYVGPVDATTTSSAYAFFQLEYYVELFHRIQLDGS